MKLGYARVSTLDQNLESQTDQLNAAGCERIFIDKVSGARDRPQLRELLDFARAGDEIVIYKLDRLGRSLSDLLQIVADLERREINLISLSDRFDTGSAAGRLFFHMAGAFAEYERAILRERTAAGLESARQRGRTGGRPRAVTPQQEKAIRAAHAAEPSVSALAAMFRVSPRTIRRVIAGTYSADK